MTTDALTRHNGAQPLRDGLSAAAPGTWREPATHFLQAMQSPWYTNLVVLQDRFTSATVEFWSPLGVRYGHLPVTTSAVSSPMGLGSDSKPVAVDMFGVETYLADSMQFGLEYLCRFSGHGAYYLMPSFRGEDVDATHLAQFMHSEAEVPGDLSTVLDVVERYLRYVTAAIQASCSDLICDMAGSADHLARLTSDSTAFSRLTFDEAVDRLDGQSQWVSHHDSWRTLTRAGEQELIRQCGPFVWVTHFDHLAVPFYQAVDGRGRAMNADLLFGPGEVVGAGERHSTAAELESALAAHGVDPQPYEWYVSMKRETPMRTAGFGLGLERYLMWLLRHDDIRDMQIMPRENGKQIIP